MCPLKVLIHCAARSPENVLFNTLRLSETLPGLTALIKKFANLSRTLPCFLNTLVNCLAQSPKGILINSYFHDCIIKSIYFVSGALHGSRTALVHSVLGSLQGVLNRLCYSEALSGSLTALS